MTSVGPTLYRGTASPGTGRDGDLWVDTTTDPAIVKVYSSSGWVDIVIIPTDEIAPAYWIRTASNYTLSNTTSAQKFFNTTTNGELTLDTGTYEFEWLVMMDQMSGTSGNATLNILGTGTCTMEQVGMVYFGADINNPDNVTSFSGATSTTEYTQTNAVTAGTGDSLNLYLRGIFKVSAAGTIVPMVSLTNATSTAFVKAGSYFKVRRIGSHSVNYVGAWT